MNKWVKKVPTSVKFIFVIAILLFLYISASVIIDQAKCHRIGKLADSAYSKGDFTNDIDGYSTLTEMFANSKYWGLYDHLYCINRDREMDSKKAEGSQILTRAAQNISEGEIEVGIHQYQYFLDNNPDSVFQPAIEESLKKAYQILFSSSSASAQGFMSKMYLSACFGTETDMPALEVIYIDGTPSKYWYPDVKTITSNLATSPSEFRVAVCYEFIEVTNTVENCIYTGSTYFGSGSASISRNNANYRVYLVDVLTGQTLADKPSVSSLEPGPCPESISTDPLKQITQINGLPDITGLSSWIIQQISTFRK